jgi:hypothetical protein
MALRQTRVMPSAFCQTNFELKYVVYILPTKRRNAEQMQNSMQALQGVLCTYGANT